MKQPKYVLGDRGFHRRKPAMTGRVSHSCGGGYYMVTWHSDMRTGRIHGRFIQHENLLDEIASVVR